MDVGCTLDVGRLFNLLTYFWWLINKYSREWHHDLYFRSSENTCRTGNR